MIKEPPLILKSNLQKTLEHVINIFESSVVDHYHYPARGQHVSAASHPHLPGDGQPHTRSLARL